MTTRSFSRRIAAAGLSASLALPALPVFVGSADAQVRHYGAPRYSGTHYGQARHYSGQHYYSGQRYYYGHRRSNSGPALAAGLIGGLALGTLAAGPSYGYGYGYGYPAYGGPTYYEPACYWGRQRVYDRWGYPHIRRVRVCE